MMVFSEMRPPVAAEDGNTPLRGKNVGKLLDMAAAEYADESGFRLTKDQILKNYTDDASLADKNWNVRHHVTPSAFNGANHKYYKVSIFALFHKQMTNSLAPRILCTIVILRQRLQEQVECARAAAEVARPVRGERGEGYPHARLHQTGQRA